MLATLSGPDASGKDTVLEGLKTIPSFPITPLPSITTRPPRDKEPDYYTFVSRVQFRELESHDFFAWTVLYGEEWYGTSEKVLVEALHAQELYLAVVTPDTIQTIYSIARAHKVEHFVCSLYLRLEDEGEIRRRLTERGGTPNLERMRSYKLWNAEALQMAKRYPIRFIRAERSKNQVLLDVHQQLCVFKENVAHIHKNSLAG